MRRMKTLTLLLFRLLNFDARLFAVVVHDRAVRQLKAKAKARVAVAEQFAVDAMP